jgi:hypothetical protein
MSPLNHHNHLSPLSRTLSAALAAAAPRLVIATTYTPFGGVAMTITRSVVVRRVSSSRRKRR